MLCSNCSKLTMTPFHITEIENGKVNSIHLCIECANDYMLSLNSKKETKDLTNITTPEQLLDFLTNNIQEMPKNDSCICGMTLQEFDEKGRFGCQHCYENFEDLMKFVVEPYHNASEHVGKRPKRKNIDTQEEIKFLKLKLAHAIEFEEYEEAAIFNERLNKLI